MKLLTVHLESCFECPYHARGKCNKLYSFEDPQDIGVYDFEAIFDNALRFPYWCPLEDVK